MTKTKKTEDIPISMWERPEEELKELTKTCFSRFADHTEIGKLLSLNALLVGCGSIGSFAALAAAKMGISNWTIVDFDIVEDHNTANQVWGHGHTGKKKATLMSGLLQNSALPKKIRRVDGKFTGPYAIGSDVIFCCVDNMETRREVFEASRDARFFFDARTGGGDLQVFTFDPSNQDHRTKYEKTLHKSENTVDLSCTDIGGCAAPLISAGILAIALTKLGAGEVPYNRMQLKTKDSLDLIMNGLAKFKTRPVSNNQMPNDEPNTEPVDSVTKKEPAVITKMRQRSTQGQNPTT